MRSRQVGKNYEIILSGGRLPFKINKSRTDKSLGKIEKALLDIKSEVRNIYNSCPDLYYMLSNESYYFDESMDDGKCHRINDLLYDIQRLQTSLKNNMDKIPKIEDVETLDDLGYTRDYTSFVLYTKTMEDTDEKEVIEEIILDTEPVRRIRTIIWEKTDYGKSSKSITYRKLRMTKKLLKAAENTRKEIKKS